MKREILFRGKRKDNGEWIEGSLLNFRENTYIIPHDSEYCYDGIEKLAFDVEYFEVRPEIVEQYTGLNDMNGRKIFEGDIILNMRDNTIWEIAYLKKYMRFAQRKPGVVFPVFSMDGVKVIGNIYDNFELLKGKRK